MRERYEDWLDDRLGVLRHGLERDRDMPAAEAKRVRKAAKRRRDAELTRLGMVADRCDIVAASLIDLGHWRDVGDIMAEMGAAVDRMRAIRRGEVRP